MFKQKRYDFFNCKIAENRSIPLFIRDCLHELICPCKGNWEGYEN